MRSEPITVTPENIDKVISHAVKKLKDNNNYKPFPIYLQKYKRNIEWRWYKPWIEKYIEIDWSDVFISNGFDL